MIQTINSIDNVFYIKNDDSREFYDLMEANYISDVFEYLKNSLDITYENYYFYITSTQTKFSVPSIKTPKEKNILIWISDELENDISYLKNKFSIIFKSYGGGGNPFPLGCVSAIPDLPYIPISRRKYSCFFSGNLNVNRLNLWSNLIGFGNYNLHPRIIFNKYMKSVIFNIKPMHNLSYKIKDSKIIFNNGFAAGLSPMEYGSIIQNSIIVLSPKGFHSSECFRTYEALRAGCVVISEKLPDNYLYHDSPIIQVNDWHNINQFVRDLISKPDYLQMLSDKSRDWYTEKLSAKATADRIILKLKSYN